MTRIKIETDGVATKDHTSIPPCICFALYCSAAHVSRDTSAATGAFIHWAKDHAFALQHSDGAKGNRAAAYALSPELNGKPDVQQSSMFLRMDQSK